MNLGCHNGTDLMLGIISNEMRRIFVVSAMKVSLCLSD